MSESHLSPAQKSRDTLIESGLLVVAVPLLGFVTTQVLEDFGMGDLNIGNANGDAIENAILEDPVAASLKIGLVYPAAEEMVFRGLPLALAAGLGSKGKLATGIASSAAFAALHGFYELPDGSTGYKVGFPLVQFAAGMLFWDIAQRKGVGHSILAHSAFNSTLLALFFSGVR